ncbi:hypothetical protein [Colwellia sp. TT2012]|uniref:hypothetical protein n=1 Tax=Colwellia sp. TT2012 TaxID=1720342 RepID=UPI000710CE90|nr:hypothetical protein [Colwellia sp. TT2012]
MNLLPINFITRHQAKLLFLVFWGHVTILDLFYVSYAGPIFFWQENFQAFTILIHLTVASLTLVFYFMLIKLMTRFRASNSAKQMQSNNSSPY